MAGEKNASAPDMRDIRTIMQAVERRVVRIERIIIGTMIGATLANLWRWFAR